MCHNLIRRTWFRTGNGKRWCCV